MKLYYQIALIILIGAGVYLNSLNNSFVWDDELLVTGNTSIRSLGSIPEVLTRQLAPVPGGNFYRPLQLVSYSVDYSLWGYNPAGYHLVNLLIHLANAVLLFLLILSVTGRRSAAFLTGLFFAVHPVQTEAVAYISGRADLLAAFFLLSSLLIYVEAVKSHSRGLVGAAIAAAILALLSKEAAIVLPLLAILCVRNHIRAFDLKRPSHPGRKRYYLLYLFIPFVLYSILRIVLFSAPGGSISSNPYPFSIRFLTGFKVVFFYFRILLLPSPLHMERVVAMERSLFAPSVLFSLLGLATVAGLALRSVKKAPGIFFGIGWFFISLLPYMNWFPLNAEMAEHWLYLPSAGFFFLLATVIIKTGERYRTLTASLLIIILAAWAILTVDRNRDWKDNISIYRQTARLSPESPRAHYNLGNLYLSRGDYRSAVRSLRRALAIKPRDFKSRRGLGKALLGMGEPLPAVAALEAAVSLRPSSAAALSELGVAYSLAGSDEKAVSALRSALEIDPFSARAHNNLASAYTRLGAFSEALTACNRALELNPDLLEARFNRGVILYHLGETEKARAQFRRVIRDDPAFRPARIWLEDTRPPDQTFF